MILGLAEAPVAEAEKGRAGNTFNDLRRWSKG